MALTDKLRAPVCALLENSTWQIADRHVCTYDAAQVVPKEGGGSEVACWRRRDGRIVGQEQERDWPRG